MGKSFRDQERQARQTRQRSADSVAAQRRGDRAEGEGGDAQVGRCDVCGREVDAAMLRETGEGLECAACEADREGAAAERVARVGAVANAASRGGVALVFAVGLGWALAQPGSLVPTSLSKSTMGVVLSLGMLVLMALSAVIAAGQAWAARRRLAGRPGAGWLTASAVLSLVGGALLAVAAAVAFFGG